MIDFFKKLMEQALDLELTNPEIVKKSGPYQAEEGCLSLTGIRKAKRWKSIKVQYQNEKFQTRFTPYRYCPGRYTGARSLAGHPQWPGC